MRKIYSVKTVLTIASLVSIHQLNAQSPTTVAQGTECNFTRTFNTTNEGFTAPSIYSSDDDVSFFWTGSLLEENSGQTARDGSFVSPTYANNGIGETNVGFTYSAPAGTQYRIRVITQTSAAASILATTAVGAVWTTLPATSGTICLKLTDADLTLGAPVRYEFSFRATTAGNMTFDNFTLSASAAPLPVTFFGFVTKENADGSTKLLWNVGEEVNVNNYSVERSIDGRTFTSIGTVDASGKTVYSFDDSQPIKGTVYYRVKNNDLDGQSKYTGVIKLSGIRASKLQLYPQPATSQAFLQHEKAPAKAIISILTMDGRVVKQIKAAANTFQTQLNIGELGAGIYFVKYDDNQGDVQTLKLIKK
jgi:hypothetical protein